ncbi:MAG: DNRLRE domain-containing protein, partial [Acidobacteriota bacterium]
MRHTTILVLLVLLAAAGSTEAAEVTLDADRDATLYDHPAGELANGVGEYLFTGYGNAPKRALLSFDLSSIPAGSTITSVELTLTMSMTIAAGQTNSLYRVESSWTEGPSDAAGPEGMGITSETGDATWIHTSYPTTFWASPGGDFAAMPSAQALIISNGDYTFGSTPEMVADVEGWFTDPTSNHGWVILGPESPLFRSAKRFNSREHSNPATRPRLRIV